MTRELTATTGEGRSLVFLDASVLVAASRSPSGGSAVSMEACQGRRFRGALTARVLLEARVNISAKFGETELLRFFHQLAALNPEMVPPPPNGRIQECISLTTENDAHVLAAALECRADYLLTLDRRHLISPAVRAAGLPVRIMTPGETDAFLASYEERRGRRWSEEERELCWAAGLWVRAFNAKKEAVDGLMPNRYASEFAERLRRAGG